MPQAVRHLVTEQDDHQEKYRRPTSFVEEIAEFLEDAWAFLLSQRELFRGYWCKAVTGVLATTIAAWLIAVLWEFIPFFNAK